eukprot:GHVO01054379.1.p1 GENE.GHVO01054379.1~~GHVO01054379.1.p1  ORF type:complete len:159 (+),score=26.61 GHVO01054379.1:216-692(+)
MTEGDDKILSDADYMIAKEFMDSARTSCGCVLVYCVTGLHRAALLATAYVMDVNQSALLVTVESLAAKCGWILMMEGHRKQLVEFASQRNLLDRIDIESELLRAKTVAKTHQMSRAGEDEDDETLEGPYSDDALEDDAVKPRSDKAESGGLTTTTLLP